MLSLIRLAARIVGVVADEIVAAIDGRDPSSPEQFDPLIWPEDAPC